MALLERMRKFFEFWYYQYILWTALYMLESWERKIFTSIVIAFVATASYTTYLFLPEHLVMITKMYNHFMGINTLAGDADMTDVNVMSS